MRKTFALLTLGLIAMISDPAHADMMAVDSFTLNFNTSGGGQSLGFDFTVNSPITVTSLGIYSGGGGSGTTAGQTINLFDVTAGDLLATAIAPVTGIGNEFNYSSLTTPQDLITGHIYSVYSVFGVSANYGFGTATLSSDLLDVTPIGDPNTSGGLYGSGGPPPTNAFMVVATDFTYTITSAAVPEPASIAMLGMGMGMAGVASVLRKMARRTV
jgi:PEP-CTERM motif